VAASRTVYSQLQSMYNLITKIVAINENNKLQNNVQTKQYIVT